MKPIVTRTASKAEGPVHPHPLLDTIYRNRGVVTPEHLDHSLARLLPASGMKGIGEAAELIADHIANGKKILVIGDFDCDGATATSVAVEGLTLLGAKQVDFLIPDRMIHGYGLTPSIVEEAALRAPDLIITVDNGIASFDGALAVRKLLPECALLITDHHLPPESGLPTADCIVNPNQPGCEFESKSIAGCGVIFYVLMGTRAAMKKREVWPSARDIPKLNKMLDLVALGTIADVVPLDQNNRILVSAGLARINEGLVRPGMASLFRVAGREIGKISSQDLAFALGPRINAAGRLEDMTLGIRCLLTDNKNYADQVAEELDAINLKRRDIEASMVDEATADLPDISVTEDAATLYRASWHEGVVGIVASRIKEKTGRPVICFTDTAATRAIRHSLQIAKDAKNETEIARLSADLQRAEIKGSARSIPGVHLKHTLDEISKRRPEMLTRFGGHAMAAGMTMPLAHYQDFRKLFSEIVSKQMTPEMRSGAILVDGADISPDLITLENAQLIQGAGPWGQGFEEPLFSGSFEIQESRVLKEKHLKLSIAAGPDQPPINAIAFNFLKPGDDIPSGTIRAVFSLDVNEWKGNKTLQLRLQNIGGPTHEHEVKEQKPSPNVQRNDMSRPKEGAGNKKQRVFPGAAAKPDTTEGQAHIEPTGRIRLAEPGSTIF